MLDEELNNLVEFLDLTIIHKFLMTILPTIVKKKKLSFEALVFCNIICICTTDKFR